VGLQYYLPAQLLMPLALPWMELWQPLDAALGWACVLAGCCDQLQPTACLSNVCGKQW